MNSYQPEKGAVPKAMAPMFDHEKLDAYQMELRFIAWVTPLLDEVLASAKGKTREVCDQLDRASLSAMLNTAEGNGKRQRPMRAKFFDDARGSATESAACLDALVAKQVATEERIIDGKKMLVRIVSMLYGLVDRFDAQGQLKDEPDVVQLNTPVAIKNVSYKLKKSKTRTRTRTKI
jgi:four helix bundle protein